MSPQITCAALALLLAFGSQPSALSQGSLTPPGAPAPTMKSLDQVEPRTPISSAPMTISSPGSYYLTANVTCAVSNAIVIATNSVTLDLKGFTIFSSVANAANGGAAILLNSGLRNITIVNGSIESGVTNNGSGVYSGGGFGYGIYSAGNAPSNVRVSDVSVSGCLNDGIRLVSLGDSILVENCTVRTVGGAGIFASTVKTALAIDCGADAIDADQASDSRGLASGSGVGINGYIAQNCLGASIGGAGVFVDTALNCYGASSTASYGILAYTAHNCHGLTSAGGYGIYTYTAENCYGTSSSGTGIYAYRSAVGCFGDSGGGSGVGLYVQTGVCFASFGHNSTATGLGLQAYVATGSYGQNAGGTSEAVNNKYNMP